MNKIYHRKAIIQDHRLLAKRLYAMAKALNHWNATDEEKLKARDLEEQALEHDRKALLNKTFIMIL